MPRARGAPSQRLPRGDVGFEHVVAFDGYRFPRNFSWEKDAPQFSPHTLLVTTPQEVVGSTAELVKTILYPDKTVAYTIYSITQSNEN